MVNVENLIRLATLVRDERANKQNTALRVGGALLELVYAIRDLLVTVGELDTLANGLVTRTRFFHGSAADVDALKNRTDLGVYVATATGWTGLLSVQFDFYSTVSQVALSSSTPDYSEGSLVWKPAPCVMFRTYTDGAWSQWQPVSGGGDLPIQIVSDAVGDFDLSDEAGYVLLRCENGHIRTKNFYSGNVYTKGEVDSMVGGGGVTQAQLSAGLATKQDKLTSGSTIKTVNGVSVLGSGNLDTMLSRHLRLVVIGNSYSADSFMYVPFILKQFGITIELGVYHRGGASLQNQVDEWSAGNGSASFWFIDSRVHSSWQVISSNYSPKKAIDYKTWDIITIQQGSIASVDYANYTTAARALINLITDEVGYPYTLAWNININRAASGSDYSAIATQILSNINNICQREPVNLIFPYGTAIFNARTNGTLNAVGDGGSLYASDKVHLQEGLPCYIAAITNVQALFNRFYPTLSVLDEGIGPTITQSVIDGWGVKGQQGTCTGISPSNCRLGQIAAILANRFNFDIKTIY